MAKYRDIADQIRGKIMSGEYTVGMKLPYEYVLCVNYHCNKETMKKALDILVKEGLIIRRRGAGTFVKETMLQENINPQFERSLTMRIQGKKEVTSQIVTFEVIPADCFLAQKMQIEEGDFIYHIIRNRSLDGEPYVEEITYIPLCIVPNLKINVLRHSLYDYILNQLHLRIQSCHINITSAPSTAAERDFFGLQKGEPYIQEEQITYLTTGSILEYCLSRYHYAHYEFSTILVNP